MIYIGIIWKINNISESQYSLLFSLLSQHDGLFLQRTNNKLNINIFIETDKGKLSILKTSFGKYFSSSILYISSLSDKNFFTSMNFMNLINCNIITIN